jgi:hypothetical protein
MNQPTDLESAPNNSTWTGASASWIDRVRPWLPLSVPALLVLAALTADLPFGGWRSPLQALASADPLSLLPGLRPDLGPATLTITHFFSTGVISALVGALTWSWRGTVRGYGFVAACTAFSLSLLIEFTRWFKPGQLPDLRDPLLAALAAATAWRLLRYAPHQPVTPLPRHGPFAIRRRVLVRCGLAVACVVFMTATACAVVEIAALGLAPVTTATLIESLPEGRTGLSGTLTRIVWFAFNGTGLDRWLRSANRLARAGDLALPAGTGAGALFDGVLPEGKVRSVGSTDSLRQAIDNASPGDVILLQPGIYRIARAYITAGRPGTETAPVVVRAPQLGLVTLESELPEALKIDAPWWRFENIVLKGVCADDQTCDNGFHVVGRAEHFVLRNVRVEDFNAQIKINGENGRFPDFGRIEHATLTNTHVRRTDVSVTPIDLVGASGWTIEANLIADFIKDGGNRVSYGAYAKGAGRGTVFTRNVVLCAWHLTAARGQQIGLSFGGGGTGAFLMRDEGRSGYEHADGTMSANLIAFCSDVGIYLNRAAGTSILHNSLIGTAGISVRYPETLAQIDGNVIDGAITARDDGLYWADGNETGTLRGMYLGCNPVRGLFVDPSRLNLRWRDLPALVEAVPGSDLCGGEWASWSPPGAFQDYRGCLSR